MGPRPPKSTKSLGTSTINGVEALGRLETTTFAAGFAGRTEEGSAVEESWYSLRIQAFVRRIRTDARNGDYEYQTTNITLGEPDPELFRIPTGYQVKDLN